MNKKMIKDIKTAKAFFKKYHRGMIMKSDRKIIAHIYYKKPFIAKNIEKLSGKSIHPELHKKMKRYARIEL